MRYPRLVQFSLVICAASLVLSGCTSTSRPVSPGATSPTQPGTSSQVAYVYVSNQTPNSYGSGSTPYDVEAYAANANGQLTAVPGSPFSENVFSLAASGGYLVASVESQPDINTYAIGSNGALTLASQFNYAQALGYQSTNDTVCSAVGGIIFDRTGQSLYGGVNNIQCSNNNAIASFAVDTSNGSLSYLGNTNIGYEASSAISMLGNDNYAYSALFDACMYGGITSFQRSNGGLLSVAPIGVTPAQGPPAPPGATSSGVSQPGYRPGLTATDATNDVAMVEYPCYAQGGVVATQVQLATYTADANGNLTTASTFATMPTTAISTPMDMEASPSGSFLAVGGIGGLQIFNFNGPAPITNLTGVLTTESVNQLAWDNSNHLYAITLSGSAYGSNAVNPGKLHVYTVTSAGATEAPGSPYTITEPEALAVQSE
jgi:hypothetical protein